MNEFIFFASKFHSYDFLFLSLHPNHHEIIMKRISIIILFAFALMSAKAQTAAQKACMQEARDAYAVAMKSMAEAQEIPELDCSFHVTKKRNFPGSGPQTYSIDYFSASTYVYFNGTYDVELASTRFP